MIEKMPWQEFKDIGLLWWVNRILHLFSWAIVFAYDSDTGDLTEVYPAKCKFRGFSADIEEAGFIALSRHIKENADDILKGAES